MSAGCESFDFLPVFREERRYAMDLLSFNVHMRAMAVTAFMASKTGRAQRD